MAANASYDHLGRRDAAQQQVPADVSAARCAAETRLNLGVRCHMSNRAAHILGWVTAALSLAVGLLGAAPFTPAIFLVAFLLPAAAFVAWRGAVVAGILSLLLCVFAFAMSPLPMAQLIEWPLAVAWLGLCSAAVVFGAVHGARARCKRHAS